MTIVLGICLIISAIFHVSNYINNMRYDTKRTKAIQKLKIKLSRQGNLTHHLGVLVVPYNDVAYILDNIARDNLDTPVKRPDTVIIDII